MCIGSAVGAAGADYDGLRALPGDRTDALPITRNAWIGERPSLNGGPPTIRPWCDDGATCHGFFRSLRSIPEGKGSVDLG
jgi:hypothetical protein